MNRLITTGYREGISTAVSRMPENIWRRVRHAGLVCALDPVFLGLHVFAHTDDTAGMTAYRHHTTDGSTTITLARLDVDAKWMAANLPRVVAHEYGHVLHETLGWRFTATAVSDYAQTSPREAFADGFATWLGFYRTNGTQRFRRVDARTEALFTRLSEASA